MQGYDYIINAILAAGIAILISIAMGPFMIPFLSRLKVGQSIREDGPKGHLKKAGTPTMGGIIIITAVMVSSFIMAGASVEVLLAVLVMLAFGGIGFWDDYIKVVLKRSLGLRAREKVGLQLLVGISFSLFLMFYLERGTSVIIPFSGNALDLGYLYIPFLVFVLLASSNAVNLTDGLDGLASGITFLVALAFLVVSLMTGHYNLAIFCGALAGACLGFLVFNRYPARVFMGDTGSMALGAAVAAVAAITRSEIALIIIGGVYVIETLSVILQIISYQTTGKRIFRMAPLHHHYELIGWSEKKVVKTFWGMGLFFVLLGLWSFKGLG
ncbi:MAG: phospho-N-acetylmuramoyl-pentapeptide-transferase [Syntrophomonadaceae bacterium]|jgi:phospho-N-acetylmuramoyl-pentapeptide-transferase|nr:phospho-N-acetylmuramoyl-pentapeptide-transferase [Syntrophomonadaceae bacterium]